MVVATINSRLQYIWAIDFREADLSRGESVYNAVYCVIELRRKKILEMRTFPKLLYDGRVSYMVKKVNAHI